MRSPTLTATSAELVALCDLSQTRMDWYNRYIADERGMSSPLPTYKASDFDRMIAETHPDIVIVTTMDSTHHIYIMRAMELGCDVITEKPMTIDLDKMKAIYDAIDRTGHSLRVSFNYRYAPAYTRFRKLVMDGVVGRPLSVDFSWLLDTSHGADYFRRWHREKQNSGGLIVHKATHHFDLVNWWIDSYPKQVFAMGGVQFYGKANAEARGEHYSYTRYTGVPEAKDDPFALFLDEKADYRGLYLDAEQRPATSATATCSANRSPPKTRSTSRRATRTARCCPTVWSPIRRGRACTSRLPGRRGGSSWTSARTSPTCSTTRTAKPAPAKAHSRKR